ncbi:hypothetical protein P691DRAFT_619679, partial [Macrolepiota fuliginosa MF-IS2]
VTRWAHLELPTGQIAWSAWKEDEKINGRHSCFVKILAHNTIVFAEVMYFFWVSIEPLPGGYPGGDETCAMVCPLSMPDPTLLESSSNALHLCYYPGWLNFAVFHAKSIQAVVAALP